MAGIERLVQTTDLKTNLWTKAVSKKDVDFDLRYDKKIDVLTLRIVSRKVPTIVHYIDDHVALLYRPDDKEIVGLRVESFERSFLPRYANLREAWKLSDVCRLENVGDLTIAVDIYEEKEPKVARELSNITRRLLHDTGLRLPVPA